MATLHLVAATAQDPDLHHPRFERSNRYDARWVIDNHMGPHPLWSLEALCEAMDLHRDDRVLDLGCGTALTSIFLAREFGVRVCAADWWIDPADNLRRVTEAAVDHLVDPIRFDARTEHPCAVEAFDAIVSIDAFHYFGTDDLFLAHMLRHLRPGGQLGIVVPALEEGVGQVVPSALRAVWSPDFWTFHSPAWWRWHWEKTELVTVTRAEHIEGAAEDWARFSNVCRAHAAEEWRRTMAADDAALLHADQEGLISFALVTATKH